MRSCEHARSIDNFDWNWLAIVERVFDVKKKRKKRNRNKNNKKGRKEKHTPRTRAWTRTRAHTHTYIHVKRFAFWKVKRFLSRINIYTKFIPKNTSISSNVHFFFSLSFFFFFPSLYANCFITNPLSAQKRECNYVINFIVKRFSVFSW